MKEGQKFSEGKLAFYTVMFEQFPNALKEVVKCSQAGHSKYPSDVDWKNFKRVGNPIFQYRNAAIRHLFEKGINQDMLEYGNILHEAQAIWNLLAALEIELQQKQLFDIINEKVPTQKDLAEFNLRELIKEYPNDMELGEAIRRLVK